MQDPCIYPQPEEWKPVVDFEHSHEVSNYGRVRSIDRVITDKNGVQWSHEGSVLALDTHTSGYPSIRLRYDGQSKRQCVHKLVARAFIGEAPGPVGTARGEWSVNHIDGDKTHNHVDNLEWLRSEDNRIHAIRAGIHSTATLTPDEVREIRRLYKTGTYTQVELGDRFGVGDSCISRVVRRETWGHVQ